LVRTETRDTKKNRNKKKIFISQKELTCSRGDGSVHTGKWGRGSRAIYIGEKEANGHLPCRWENKGKNPQWEVNDG